MHGLPTADYNSIGELKDYRKTPAFFEVLGIVYMCNSTSCSSELVAWLEEHNSKETVESLESSEDTDTGTVQFQASIHIHAIMSCPLFSACSSTFCCTTCLSGTWFSREVIHHYTCMHRSNWDSLIKQHLARVDSINAARRLFGVGGWS